MFLDGRFISNTKWHIIAFPNLINQLGSQSDVSFKSQDYDPLKLKDMPTFKKLPKISKKTYLATWMAFTKQ